MIPIRLLCASAILAAMSILGGCQDAISMDPESDAALDISLAESARSRPIKEAVIAHHVLYPYHFVSNAAELNELGLRDVAIMAEHFSNHPGSINIRRQDMPAALFQARVEAVCQALGKDNVDIKRIVIEDTLPAGDGMDSQRVLRIMAERPQTGGATAGETGGYAPVGGTLGAK